MFSHRVGVVSVSLRGGCRRGCVKTQQCSFSDPIRPMKCSKRLQFLFLTQKLEPFPQKHIVVLETFGPANSISKMRKCGKLLDKVIMGHVMRNSRHASYMEWLIMWRAVNFHISIDKNSLMGLKDVSSVSLKAILVVRVTEHKIIRSEVYFLFFQQNTKFI